MEQEKIGKFIAHLRKEKELTQQELAKKLGITDRAISKWENGRGMPDLSLLIPLCKELGISVNELLSGEYLKEISKEKYEESVIKTINYSNKKINNNKKKFLIILSVIITTIILSVSIFVTDVRRMQNNEPVLFSNWGFDYVPPIDLKEEEMKTVISDFLIKINELESKHYNNEKWFVSFKTYLIEEIEKNKEYVFYTWVLEESYYLKNGNPILESGSSIPYKFILKKENNNYIVDSYQIPRDGSLYEKDMKKIFPKSVLEQINLVQKDGTIEKLSLDIKKQVSLYFHL